MVYLLTFIIFLVIILLMSVGVLAHRKPIQGSCGGLSGVGIEKVCDCETPCDEHARLYQIQEPEQSDRL
ncbi:MAG: hypothetical protein CENE_02260 [Candidatus Celerinatantimonas neptuna]|nr:MAG: hypothetical protein CENE_02260 [Candidatus Celerinatantimonas neptuna]